MNYDPELIATMRAALDDVMNVSPQTRPHTPLRFVSLNSSSRPRLTGKQPMTAYLPQRLTSASQNVLSALI